MVRKKLLDPGWKWHICLHPTFHWSELSHMIPPNYIGGWKMQYSCVLMKERREQTLWSTSSLSVFTGLEHPCLKLFNDFFFKMHGIKLAHVCFILTLYHFLLYYSQVTLDQVISQNMPRFFLPRMYVFCGFLCLDHSKYLHDRLLFILKCQLKIHL